MDTVVGHEKGRCPSCASADLRYVEMSRSGTKLVIRYFCGECGSLIDELYTLVYVNSVSKKI